jgi:hypothetical protein
VDVDSAVAPVVGSSKQIFAMLRGGALGIGIRPRNRSCIQQETSMANREQRGNREKRKKKADRPKTPPTQTGAFVNIQKVTARRKSGASQKRK